MRVRISYGIDIEKIPEELSRLKENTSHTLNNVLKKISDTVDYVEDENYEVSLSILSKARESLAEADSILGDMHAILSGLNNFYKGEQDVSTGRPSMDTGGSNASET